MNGEALGVAFATQSGPDCLIQVFVLRYTNLLKAY